MKKDNAGKQEKVYFRQLLLDEITPTAVMETNGGVGALYNSLYRPFPGVVFEKDIQKAEALAKQRPTWAVYGSDCVACISHGVGFHLPINFFDIDPYGECWPIVKAIFSQSSRLPDRFGMVVNDGLKRFLMLGRGWKLEILDKYVVRFGNQHVSEKYLDICHDLMLGMAADAGYEIDRWVCHSGGHGVQMTHFCAVLQKKAPG